MYSRFVGAALVCAALFSASAAEDTCGCNVYGYGDPTPKEQELMVDWPDNYKASESVGGNPQNEFRQRCRLRKFHFANNTDNKGCSTNACTANKDLMIEQGHTCKVACCSYCAEDMPTSQRVGMVVLKGGTQIFMTWVTMKTFKTCKPHFAQARASGKLIGTLTILISLMLCSAFYWILSLPWFLYHVVLLSNGGGKEMYPGFDTLSKAWDPNVTLICTVTFTLAQLNLIFLWEEMICPDDQANKMKSIHNIKSSAGFIKKLLTCYVVLQVTAVGVALALQFYILTIIVTMFTWLSLQCYVSCKFLNSSRKIIKELSLASSSTGGNEGLNALIVKVTKVVRAVGLYGSLIIVFLFFPLLKITIGVLFRVKTSTMSVSWPAGGHGRCYWEVVDEWGRTMRKIFHMMVILKIGEVLTVKEMTGKGKKVAEISTAVSEGGGFSDESADSSATGKGEESSSSSTAASD